MKKMTMKYKGICAKCSKLILVGAHAFYEVDELPSGKKKWKFYCDDCPPAELEVKVTHIEDDQRISLADLSKNLKEKQSETKEKIILSSREEGTVEYYQSHAEWR